MPLSWPWNHLLLKEACGPPWLRNRSWRTAGPLDSAAGIGRGGRGLAQKLRSGDFPLPYLGEGPITCPGDLVSHERGVPLGPNPRA